MTTTVHIVSLGCARNDVDSEELAGRLAAGGFSLVDEPSDADAIVVNTCGFIETAKKDSIDTLLAAADMKSGRPRKVIAVGCLAERYGRDLSAALPEADAVLGFDAYGDIDRRLTAIMAGEKVTAHVPHDRRRPLQLVERESSAELYQPGLLTAADVPSEVGENVPSPRQRLVHGPSAPVKIASGCDRRCAFCAIPAFRGNFVSRPPEVVVAEVRQLVAQGVKEAFLVSENTTSYGKDLRDVDALPKLLEQLSVIDGLEWIRVSYLQPAEIRPGLLESICSVDKVVPYFDLSFQHASQTVLRRMRRYGSPEQFLALLARIRELNPLAGIRSNVIVGFPGETEHDLDLLSDFIAQARLDALGVFPYSDEEGTEGAKLDDHIDEDEIQERYERISTLASVVSDARAEERIGERVAVLIESHDDGTSVGRAQHQGPEVDGTCIIAGESHRVGDVVWGIVTETDGVDLIVQEEVEHGE